MNHGNALSITALILALVLLLSAAQAGEESRNMPDPWDAFVHEFIEAHFIAHPAAAAAAGRHEFDGKLPDWSPAGLEREVTRLRAARDKALSFSPAGLDDRRRFEREYLIAVVEGKLYWLTSANWPYRNPVFYERALDPQVYVTREYAPLPKRMHTSRI